MDTDHTHFSAEDHAVVADLLASLPPGDHKFSVWLAELRADGVAPRLLRLLGRRLLGVFGNPGDPLAARYDIRASGQPLIDADFLGDDLLLRKRQDRTP